MSGESKPTSVRPYKRSVYFCDDYKEAELVADQEYRKGEKVSIVTVAQSQWQIGYQINSISKYAVVIW